MGIRSKNLASGSLNHCTGYGRNSTIFWMLIQSIYHLLKNLAPVLLQGIAIQVVLLLFTLMIIQRQLSCSSYLFTLSLLFFWICSKFGSGFLQDVVFFKASGLCFSHALTVNLSNLFCIIHTTNCPIQLIFSMFKSSSRCLICSWKPFLFDGATMNFF